jgi:hypothetical protein
MLNQKKKLVNLKLQQFWIKPATKKGAQGEAPPWF